MKAFIFGVLLGVAMMAGESQTMFLPGPGGLVGPWNPSPWNRPPWNPSPWPYPQPGGNCGCHYIYLPECGWDMQTYPNACVRNCYGVPKAYDGPCYGGGFPFPGIPY